MSTWRGMRIACPSNTVQWTHLSCVVFQKFSVLSVSVLLMCSSHSLPDSACPCRACCAGETGLQSTGSPNSFSHQMAWASSICANVGRSGGGECAKERFRTQDCTRIARNRVSPCHNTGCRVKNKRLQDTCFSHNDLHSY